MEDYIFLIIAVILSIVGAINKNKKKKTDENQLTEKPERPKNFFMDQLLGEDFLAGEEEEIKPAPKPRPVVIRKKEPAAPKVSSSILQRPAFVSSLPSRTPRGLRPQVEKPPVAEETEIEPVADQPDYLEDFSLRKAFVYSEILQRKYE